MGLFLLLLAPPSAIAAIPETAQRADRPVRALLVPTGPLSADTTARSSHRLLHAHGPKPTHWDGDWPEPDLDLAPTPALGGPILPPNLAVRLCWCSAVQRSATTLPGAGAGNHWTDTDTRD